MHITRVNFITNFLMVKWSCFFQQVMLFVRRVVMKSSKLVKEVVIIYNNDIIPFRNSVSNGMTLLMCE